QGKKYCEERGMALPVVRNDADNNAIAKVLADGSNSAWIDQTLNNGRWVFDMTEKITYSRWFLGSGSPSVNCTASQAATVAGSKIDKCVKYACWEPIDASAKNTVICVRP
ncbi:hypothetical protein PFISCL1PPCAC_3678, partial [Pristionchus fissidentatus]